SNPAACAKVVIPATGYLTQDGPAVQTFAIKKTAEIFGRISATTNGSPFLVGHQANLPMLLAACKRAGIVPERHLHTVGGFGNCGAAGSASVLSEHWDGFRPGDEVCLAVVGAGLTWGAALLRFT